MPAPQRPHRFSASKRPAAEPARVQSFPPVVGAHARILILGSMPGVASLRAQQYYAHPQNQFWKIISGLCGAGIECAYSRRLSALRQHGWALWDVLQSCVRCGSLDAAIEHHSAVANDLLALLHANRSVMRLCCNGGMAHSLLQRYFAAQLAQELPHLEIVRLPSTSAANASWSYPRKLQAWRSALRLEQPLSHSKP